VRDARHGRAQRRQPALLAQQFAQTRQLRHRDLALEGGVALDLPSHAIALL